ncbi:MAG: YhbY family RNA-binding protein, partial [Pseudomonadales bacterium]
TVVAEIERALNDHELIKVKVNVGDRNERDDVITRLCEQTESSLIQAIGNVAVLYKKAAQADPALSNILRADVL